MSLKLPRGLYALIDDGVRADLPVAAKARAAINGGARVLQLRLEQTVDRLAPPIIREVVTQARRADVLVIVNDRVDLALLGGAHGVHLGADDLPVMEARRLLGPELLVGATCRTLEEVLTAQGQGADHAGVGPLFQTSTKVVAHPPLGLAEFAKIAKASPIPVIGIGGIGLDTIGAVADAGAHCAAVAGGLLQAPDIADRARALQAAFFEGVK